MKRRVLAVCFASLLAAVALAACALSGGRPADNEMGYIKCTSDSDCEVGVCLDREPFDYCGTECTIDDDCIDLSSETGFVMACVDYRCEATDEAIEQPEDGDEPEDGDVDEPADGDVEPDGDLDADADEDGELDGDVEADVEVEAEAEVEAEVEIDGDVELDAEVEAEAEIEVDGDSDSELETDDEVEAEADAEVEVDE